MSGSHIPTIKVSQLASLKFLGTGTSMGIPIIGCKCNVCTSQDPRDKRLRSSALLSIDGYNILIDAGPDLRTQMLRSKTMHIDAVLLTHEHKDHIGGIDDLRPFNYLQKSEINIYAEHRVCEAIRREYAYAFEENPYPGVPSICLNRIDESAFYIGDIKIVPIRGMHRDLPVLGFRIGDIAYLTDMNYILNDELQKLFGTKYLVINALRIKEHFSHFNLEAALDIVASIKPIRAFLTHISHEMGVYSDSVRFLPENAILAFDGMEIII